MLNKATLAYQWFVVCLSLANITMHKYHFNQNSIEAETAAISGTG